MSTKYNKCYVCNRAIKDKWRQVYIGQGLYRHSGCEAGSRRWFKSTHPVIQKFKVYFKGVENGRDINKNK